MIERVKTFQDDTDRWYAVGYDHRGHTVLSTDEYDETSEGFDTEKEAIEALYQLEELYGEEEDDEWAV